MPEKILKKVNFGVKLLFLVSFNYLFPSLPKNMKKKIIPPERLKYPMVQHFACCLYLLISFFRSALW